MLCQLQRKCNKNIETAYYWIEHPRPSTSAHFTTELNKRVIERPISQNHPLQLNAGLPLRYVTHTVPSNSSLLQVLCRMASNAAAQTQQINVTDLDVPQLADVRRQLEEVLRTAPRKHCEFCTHYLPHIQELTHLSNSYAQLRQAQAKFRACIENVGQVKPENKGPSAAV